MAKKTTNKDVENSDPMFDDINSILDSFEDSYGCIMDEKSHVPIRDWISTGNYMLNGLISGDIFKGIPSGKLVQLAGENATGKTYIALNICKQAIKQGYSVIYFDSENAIDYEQLVDFGVSGPKFRHQIVNTVEQLATMCKKITSKIIESGRETKVLFIIDSVGNLSTTKEITDVEAGNEKEDMTRPKRIKKFFRVLTTDLAKTQIPCIAINHVYANTGGFVAGNIIGGGSGTLYNSSVIIELGKSQIKDGDLRTGTLVTAKLSKSRYTTCGTKKKFIISFKKPLNPFIGLQTMANDEKELMEIYNNVGIGIGNILKDGTFTTASIKKLEEFNKTGFVVDGKKVKPSEFFGEQTWTQERLEKINEYVGRQLKFNNEGGDDIDYENLNDEVEM